MQTRPRVIRTITLALIAVGICLSLVVLNRRTRNFNLATALKDENTRLALELLQAGAIPDMHRLQAAGETRSALQMAAALHDIRVLNMLIDLGENIDARDDVGNTPLIAAAATGSVENVDTLLRHGADPNASNNSGDTPLFVAAQNGPSQIVQELLEKGASVNNTNHAGKTALFVAARSGHVTIVHELLEHGAKPDMCDRIGETALTSACRFGNTAIAQLLLDKGASVDMSNDDRRTPLMIAAHEHDIETANVLLSRGASANRTDAHGNTALLFASARIDEILHRPGDLWLSCPELIRLLIKHGAQVNARDAAGNSPLTTAARFGLTDNVRALLAAGADNRITTKHPWSAFLNAVNSGKMDCIRLLWMPTISMAERNMALYSAAEEMDANAVKFMLEHGADPQSKQVHDWAKAVEGRKDERTRATLRLLGQL
jgi:ankyrin repeat protein